MGHALSRWQTEEPGPHSLYAQTARYSQLHRGSSMACPMARLESPVRRHFLLTFTTVAVNVDVLTWSVGLVEPSRERVDRSL